MNVTLCTLTENRKNAVIKTFTEIKTISAQQIEQMAVSDLECTIVLNFNNSISMLTNSNLLNYAYINLERTIYYFVDKIEFLAGSRIVLHLTEDVLATYSDEILQLNCLITRQENIKSNFIVDNFLPLKNEKTIKVIEFDNSEFNLSTATKDSYNFLLTVAGGGTNGTQQTNI